MAHLLTLLYAPLVLLAMLYMPVVYIGWAMIAVAIIWIYFKRNSELKYFLFPLFYGLGGVMALVFKDALALMTIPFFLSTLFFLFFLSPQGGVWLCALASRFFSLRDEELVYIEKSRFFWAFIAFINTLIHAFLISSSEPSTLWATYASFGWYGVFISGGLLQYIHQKIYFKKGFA